ncbi:unnamed protein product [Caenorhabditis auriculariae]|uniref:Nuclear receptor domain-containing protein n=1 Tax=Caenorhabditis auriculariae TaxID=2777116 RepID=A0A8S1HPQ1_9PELO|nr:unnamed protein product [Caenorhabditis auriculariae]
MFYTSRESTSSDDGNVLALLYRDSPHCSAYSEASSPNSVLEEAQVDEKMKDPKKMCPTTCLVCGLAATGYHYDAATCNGCKAFFRRAVLSGKKMECRGTCSNQKKRCRACRFEKCLAVGMNSQILQSKDDYRQFIDLQVDDEPKSKINEEARKTIESLLRLEKSVEVFRLTHKRTSEIPTLDSILQAKCSMSQVCKVEDATEGEDELSLPSTSKSPEIELESWNRDRPLECSLWGTVEYAKSFQFFASIESRDKVILLKSAGLKCHLLSDAFEKVSLGKTADGNGIDETLRRLDITKGQCVLLKAITLCNPAVDGLSQVAQNLLTTSREKYASALFAECQSSRGTVRGATHFCELLAVVGTLEQLQKKQRDLYVMNSLQRPASPTRSLIDELLS